MFMGKLPKRPTGADCKSAGATLRWSESTTFHFIKEHWWTLWTVLFYFPVGFYMMMKYNGGIFEKHLLIVVAIWLFPMLVYFLYLIFHPIFREVNRE